MLNIKKTAFYFTNDSVEIEYTINNRSNSIDITENGECDLNDLDEFCSEFLPDYQIGVLSIYEMQQLAQKIYAEYKKEGSLKTAILIKIKKIFAPSQKFLNDAFHPSHQKFQLCLQ